MSAIKQKTHPGSPHKKINYKELLQRYGLLQSLMDCIPDVIYFKDRRGRLILVNKAHAKGLGLSPEEVVGKTDFDIFPKERAARMAKDDEYVMTTGKSIIDKIERSTRPDGVDNYVSTTKIPRYDDKRRIIGLIGITRDITQRMQLAHLREEEERIKKKLEAMEHLNKIKSDFISMASHELKTPLAVIKEGISIILDGIKGPIAEGQKQVLLSTKNNVERLRKIIEELLDISRIEKGKIKLHYSLINLNELIKDSALFFQKIAHNKGINLVYKLPRNQVNIFIDPDKINQVLSNLIDNALKFTEQKGQIEIEVKVLEDRVRVGVIDTGVGISRKDLTKIFNRFEQATVSTDIKNRGIGLGLSIAKELIEKHGGEIWAESKPGIGSKFYFTLSRFYTTAILDKELRQKINNLLNKAVLLYLINILIVNFKKFRNRIKIKPKKLSADLEKIILEVVKNFKPLAKSETEIVKYGHPALEFSIIFPQATASQADRLSQILKNNIKDYFTCIKPENVFISSDIRSDSYEKMLSPKQAPFINVCFKKIYIGSEMRRFRRIPYRLDIEIISPKEKAQIVQTVDISRGGLCFTSRVPFETDSRLQMKTKLLTQRPSFCFNGRVAWIRNIDWLSKAGDKHYRIGLEFINLTKKNKSGLLSFFKFISRQDKRRAKSPY